MMSFADGFHAMLFAIFSLLSLFFFFRYAMLLRFFFFFH